MEGKINKILGLQDLKALYPWCLKYQAGKSVPGAAMR